jgi:hypothetical protein
VPTPATFRSRLAEFPGHYKTALKRGFVRDHRRDRISFLLLRFGHVDQGNDPKASTASNGYDLIGEGFGVGFNSVFTLIMSGPDGAIKTMAEFDPTSVVATPVGPGTTLGLISLKSVTSPQDARTTELVNTLHRSLLPLPLQNSTNHLYACSLTAIFADFTSDLSAQGLPGVVAGPPRRRAQLVQELTLVDLARPLRPGPDRLGHGLPLPHRQSHHPGLPPGPRPTRQARHHARIRR